VGDRSEGVIVESATVRAGFLVNCSGNSCGPFTNRIGEGPAEIIGDGFRCLGGAQVRW
jgi:hypothetical protein